VPGVDSVSGGPCTIAATPGKGAWLLVNRDVTRERTLTVHWSAPRPTLSLILMDGARVMGGFATGSPSTAVTLAPGQSAVLAPHAP